MKTQLSKFSRSLRLVVLAGFTLTFAAALPVFAQAQSGGAPPAKQVELSQVEHKNRAPISKEVLHVKIPQPSEYTLPNGLTVLILEDHRFPIASVQFTIDGAGALYDPTDMPGLATTTAQMLREGTKTRTSKELADAIDNTGASIFTNAGFGSANTLVNASGLSENFDTWFSLTLDVLLHPAFSAEELANVKQRQKTGMVFQRSNPLFLANERFNRAVYGNFPAAISSATVQSIDAMSSENLAKWHDEHYVPQNAILAISGDVSAATLLPKLKQWLAEWRKTDSSPKMPAIPTPVEAREIYLVDRPKSVQTTLWVGNIAIDRRSPDYLAFSVMNNIFGGGPSARLFTNLRENKGYTYGVYSNFVVLQYPGYWRAYGDYRTNVTDGAMTELINEINRIRDEKVSAIELEDAKRAIVAGFALQLENPQQVMFNAVTRRIYGFPTDYWDTYAAKVMAITSDDVQRVARKYINAQTMQVVAVGDASIIKAVLEKYGTVEMFSADGKPSGTN